MKSVTCWNDLKAYGIDALTGTRMQRPEQMVEKGIAQGGALTFLPSAPLMHGASQWAVMGQSFVGNCITLVPHFEPAEIWRLIEQERINMVMITGDAMGKPLIEALDEPGVQKQSLYFVSVPAASKVSWLAIDIELIGNDGNGGLARSGGGGGGREQGQQE